MTDHPAGPHLVLAGAGYAHLFVVAALARGRIRAGATTLVSPHDRQIYSGMVPGLIGGRYSLEQVAIDLPRLCDRAGVRFLRGAVERLDPPARTMYLDDGSSVTYDVASLATGGVAAGTDRPGVEAHAHFIRPTNRTEELLAAIERMAATRGPETLQVKVVGAGASGVELALALRLRLDRMGVSGAVITLYDTTHAVLRDRSQTARALARRALATSDITLGLTTTVEEVGPSHVRLSGGKIQPADLVVWTTGSAAQPLFRASGLPVDPKGFLLVERTLQVQGTPNVFATGDAATLIEYPLISRSRDAAVRQAPVLIRNLRLVLDAAAIGRSEPGMRLSTFRPRARLRSLLNTADGSAILTYGERATAGRWAMWLKDTIDRSFVRQFQRLA